jgi:pyridoxine/pyridoxamine 5'-phosphate oxidase
VALCLQRTEHQGTEDRLDGRAALTFYWPQRGRQIRVRGSVSSAGPEISAQDFLQQVANSAAPFTAWQAKPDRVDY